MSAASTQKPSAPALVQPPATEGSDRRVWMFLGGCALAFWLLMQGLNFLQDVERNMRSGPSSQVAQPQPHFSDGVYVPAPASSGSSSDSSNSSSPSWVPPDPDTSWYNNQARETQQRMIDDAYIKASRERHNIP